jgi:hypothetical protein
VGLQQCGCCPGESSCERRAPRPPGDAKSSAVPGGARRPAAGRPGAAGGRRARARPAAAGRARQVSGTLRPYSRAKTWLPARGAPYAYTCTWRVRGVEAEAIEGGVGRWRGGASRWGPFGWWGGGREGRWRRSAPCIWVWPRSSRVARQLTGGAGPGEAKRRGGTAEPPGSWAPQPLSPSAPQLLSPSAPQPLSPSAPQPLGRSAPRPLGPSAPRPLGPSAAGPPS